MTIRSKLGSSPRDHRTRGARQDERNQNCAIRISDPEHPHPPNVQQALAPGANGRGRQGCGASTHERSSAGRRGRLCDFSFVRTARHARKHRPGHRAAGPPGSRSAGTRHRCRAPQRRTARWRKEPTRVHHSGRPSRGHNGWTANATRPGNNGNIQIQRHAAAQAPRRGRKATWSGGGADVSDTAHGVHAPGACARLGFFERGDGGPDSAAGSHQPRAVVAVHRPKPGPRMAAIGAAR